MRIRVATTTAASEGHKARPLLGTTIQRFHERVRVEWACRLLQETSLHIGEVAVRVGYSDPLYFSRVFRRAVGRSPRQWRRSETARRGAAALRGPAEVGGAGGLE